MATRIDLPPDELRRLYIEEGLSSVVIAKKFECNPLTIRARLRDYAIPLRQRGWHKRVRHISDSLLSSWPSSNLAYILGLIASDGHLPLRNNCVVLTTTDQELVDLFRILLAIPNSHVTVSHPQPPRKVAYQVQVCDYVFREFVEGKGITTQKTLTIRSLDIPDKVFADFLRGELDGDGGWHIGYGWRQIKYLVCKFTSKSRPYLKWLNRTTKRLTGLVGRFSGHGLVYNGHNAERLGSWLYYRPNLPCLSRKYNVWKTWVDKNPRHTQLNKGKNF